MYLEKNKMIIEKIVAYVLFVLLMTPAIGLALYALYWAIEEA